MPKVTLGNLEIKFNDKTNGKAKVADYNKDTEKPKDRDNHKDKQNCKDYSKENSKAID